MLWARDKVAEDSGISDEGARWGGIALAKNVHSREEVHNNIIEHARSKAAEITREPSEIFTAAYAGVFIDLDDHMLLRLSTDHIGELGYPLDRSESFCTPQPIRRRVVKPLVAGTKPAAFKCLW